MSRGQRRITALHKLNTDKPPERTGAEYPTKDIHLGGSATPSEVSGGAGQRQPPGAETLAQVLKKHGKGTQKNLMAFARSQFPEQPVTWPRFRDALDILGWRVGRTGRPKSLHNKSTQ